METLRTPDERFADLPDYPHPPSYVDLPVDDGDEVRMAYVDVGPRDGPVALLLHGEPSWGFVYRSTLPPLVEQGIRCVVPDLIGFGRSDKPTDPTAHTYAAHVAWVRGLVERLDLRDITLVGQDWGGLIGLRLATEADERFTRIVAANTGLPTGEFDMPEVWHRFRRAVESAPELDIGRLVQSGCVRPLDARVRAAYDAPYPDERHKTAPRCFPGLVPIRPDDPATAANRVAWERLTRWTKPFLVAFSDGDPITAAMAPILRRNVPGAAGRESPVITDAGHFLQEDAGVRLGSVIAAFMTA
ncbi:MAG: haloalkane dehalogenase [Nocardioidaceae bacterium]